jgi:hypothetical protein
MPGATEAVSDVALAAAAAAELEMLTTLVHCLTAAAERNTQSKVLVRSLYIQ